MAKTTASINKPKDSKGSNGHYLTVFYNVRGKTATKAAAALDGESRYLSAVGKGAAGRGRRPCWNVLELLVCNAETVGHSMITPANFQRPYCKT
jgi:hypothetical protein